MIIITLCPESRIEKSVLRILLKVSKKNSDSSRVKKTRTKEIPFHEIHKDQSDPFSPTNHITKKKKVLVATKC